MLLLPLYRPRRGNSTTKKWASVVVVGVGRQDTIMQRSVHTVLPTSRSTPPANANIHAKAGTFPSPPSPSARVSSPTTAAVARPRQAPNLAPAPVHVHLFLHAHNLHLARTLVPTRPAPRSSFGSVFALAAARPSTIVAFSKPNVDSDTSEPALEADSDESDDSEDDIPLQSAAQPGPGTSISTRTATEE